MGNFEKLVVLTVLFLVATILGISMQEESTGVETDPLGNGGRNTVAERPEVELSSQPMGEALKPSLSGVVAVDPRGTSKPVDASAKPVDSDRVKSVEAGLDAKPKQLDPVKPQPQQNSKPLVDSDGRQTILITTEGLTKPLVGDEYMLYTFQQGDSITVLANRFFGDRLYRTNLRLANEGVSFVPGAHIMIPKFDFTAEAGNRDAFQPAPVHAAPSLSPKETQPKVATEMREYTVVDGDSLWKIAGISYGDAKLWGEIFKANRDQMSDENDIKVGMTLRLPAL